MGVGVGVGVGEGPGSGRDETEGFPHLDRSGNARMVDVTAKSPTERRAVATGRVSMSAATARLVRDGALPAGDVLTAARTAGQIAAKQTADLLPLCHPILLGDVTVDFVVGSDRVEVVARVEAIDRTGVEMEALTACSVAGLTIYASCKSLDRSLRVEEVTVVEKSGGRSGSWTRGPDGTVSHEPRGAPCGEVEAGEGSGASALGRALPGPGAR